jgi:hypothetical protein
VGNVEEEGVEVDTGLELWVLECADDVLMLVLDVLIGIGFWFGFGVGVWILVLLQPGLRSGRAVGLVFGIVFVLALSAGILGLSQFL